MSEKVITEVPLEFKASPSVEVEVVHTPTISEVPFNRDDAVEVSVAPTANEIISDIGTYRIPRQLGEAAIGRASEVMIDVVPGANGLSVIESGALVSSPREKVTIGTIDDFKGGDPSRVIGFNGITKK